MSTTMTMTTTWDDVRSEWSKAEQMGHQAVLQAAKVGRMLIDMKGDEPLRDFVQRAEHEMQGLKQTSIHNLMNFGKHIALIEAEKPGSQRAALALIKKSHRPPTPQRSSAALAQIKKEAEESRATHASKGAEAGPIAYDDSPDTGAYEAGEETGWFSDSAGDDEPVGVRIFTEVEYQLIHDCLDPDRDVEFARKAKAFRLFRGRRELLVCPCNDVAPLDGGVGELVELRAA